MGKCSCMRKRSCWSKVKLSVNLGKFIFSIWSSNPKFQYIHAGSKGIFHGWEYSSYILLFVCIFIEFILTQWIHVYFISHIFYNLSQKSHQGSFNSYNAFNSCKDKVTKKYESCIQGTHVLDIIYFPSLIPWIILIYINSLY